VQKLLYQNASTEADSNKANHKKILSESNGTHN